MAERSESPSRPDAYPDIDSVPLSLMVDATRERIAILMHEIAKRADEDNAKPHLQRQLAAMVSTLRVLLSLQYWMGAERRPRQINFVLGELLHFPADNVELAAILARMPTPPAPPAPEQFTLTGDPQ